MSDQFLGQIPIFGFTFAPAGFAQRNGQLIAINQNQALFALLGTTYGAGTESVPSRCRTCKGRFPLHFEQGVGLSLSNLGQAGARKPIR